MELNFYSLSVLYLVYSFLGWVGETVVATIVEAITPVPGGVGAVTTAILASHVIEAAKRS